MKKRSIFSNIITKGNYECRERGLSTGSMLIELEFKDYLRIARIECARSHDHTQCLAKGWRALHLPIFVYHSAYPSLMSQMVCVPTERESFGERVHHL